MRCDRAQAWSSLQAHFRASGGAFDVRRAFDDDAGRFAALSDQAPHVFADLSKNLIDARAEQLLLQLARECDLESYRDAMFEGDAVNVTEDRAVLHTLLRRPLITGNASTLTQRCIANGIEGKLREVHEVLDAMLEFAERVRADHAITDIVNIGIGGSDLGPQMAVLALHEFKQAGKRFHFVSNVDGHELASVLHGLAPEHTLFLVASKTFTTAETMLNAQSARRWFEQAGGVAAKGDKASLSVARHFVALTSNVAAAREFGIDTTFGFWDWVGGRYSLWSAIGLPIALAIGAEGFRSLLAGAHAMDEHFRTAPLEHNLPVRLGLLDVWYRDFHGFGSRCIAPYHAFLRRLPAYLQQLEMESNGKRVDASGQPLSFASAPVLWGEPGTNGQHAYFQMLHQGTDVVPLEFIAVRDPGHSMPGHHAKLLANALAQAQALMQGKQADSPGLGAAKNFPGNRPSTFFCLERLTPESLGAFLALYEHRVFTSGALWGIDSFDQWGVELGKVLAKDIESRLASGDVRGLDQSTAGLLQRLHSAPAST